MWLSDFSCRTYSRVIGLTSLLVLAGLATHTQAASCVYKVDNDWGTGFQSTITITNNGATAINGWAVNWQFAKNKITSSWNATLTGSNPYSATSLAWNSSIPVGQSVSFGFQGDTNGVSAEVPKVTGSVCSAAASSSSSAPKSSASSSVLSSSKSSSSAPSVFAHPGIIHNAAELKRAKAKVKNLADTRFQDAFAVIKTDDGVSPKYINHAKTPIVCGYNGVTDGVKNYDCDNQVNDAQAAYSLALMWYLTDDVQYAQRAMTIIHAWEDIYVYDPDETKRTNQGLNSDLTVSWVAPYFVNAAEILRYGTDGKAYAGWSANETAKFITFIDKFLPFLSEELKHKQNWEQSANEALIAIAVFKDDKATFDKSVDRWKRRIKALIYQRTDRADQNPFPEYVTGINDIPKLWRANPTTVSLNPGFFIDGLESESCRDMGHTKMGFASAIYTAQTAWHQNIDLFNTESGRLADFMQLHAGWMTGNILPDARLCNVSDSQGTQPQQVLPCFAFDQASTKTKDWVPYCSYDLNDAVWEMAYFHVYTRLKTPLTEKFDYAAEYNKKSRLNPNNGAHHWQFKWETLINPDE